LTADSPEQRSNVEAPAAYDRPADVTGGLWIVNDEKPPGGQARGFLKALRGRRRNRSLRLRPAADHEAVIGVTGHLPPQKFVVAERLDRGPHLLVVSIGRRSLCVHFLRSLEARFHHRQRESLELRAVGDQALERSWVARVVTRRLFNVGCSGGCG